MDDPITLRVMDAGNADDLNRCDRSFTADRTLRIFLEGEELRYRVERVEPFHKHYPVEVDPQEYAGNPDRDIFLAYTGGAPVGQVAVDRNWNGYALIRDLAVARERRRHGVGRMLVERAVSWAREYGLPGVTVETQNINVAACRLYERCGFVLGGFDRLLYRAAQPGTGEIALFWYLVF